MARFHLSPQDHARISAAVTAAEAHSSAEIVTVMAPRSDSYHDVGLHWAILCALLVPAFAAAFPAFYQGKILWLLGEWSQDVPARTLILFLLGHMILKFLAVRYLLAIPRLRMFFTPAATKDRRVRRAAVTLFRALAEGRTRSRTGILLYLSLAERRAELVVDAAITAAVAPEQWGDAMVALVHHVRKDAAGDGMVAAIGMIGAILAEHVPREADDSNELPDRLIEL